MSDQSKTLQLFQGETLELDFTWQNEDAVPFDLAGYTAELLLFPQDVTTPIVYAGTALGGNVSPNITFEVEPVDTAALAAGLHEARIRMTSAGGKVYILPDNGHLNIRVKELV